MPPRKRKRVDEEELPVYEKVQKKKSKQFLSDASGSVEKRGAILKKRCPKVILDRVERVMSQRWVAYFFFHALYPEDGSTLSLRFFMVARSREGDELREQFSVLGSTGNVNNHSFYIPEI
jgi:hypothetical protein